MTKQAEIASEKHFQQAKRPDQDPPRSSKPDNLSKVEPVKEKTVSAPPKKSEKPKQDSQVFDYLKNIPLLSKLNDSERAQLGSSLVRKEFSKGTNIITQGDAGLEFFLIMKGGATVIRELENGKEAIVAQLHEGDYFGEGALLTNDPRQATVRASSDSICLALDSQTFHKLFGKSKLNIHIVKRNAIVSSEPNQPAPERDPALYTKTEEQEKFLTEAISKSSILKNFEPEQIAQIVRNMWIRKVPTGQDIIKQGEAGDNFYVVESGEFDIFKNGEKVNHANPGSTFGELALIYNAPRAATVTAISDATVWAVDRLTFRSNLRNVSQQKLQEYEEFLRTVPSLQSLLRAERLKIAEALEDVSFKNGEKIVVQGEQGDAFYIVKKGEVVVTKTDDKEKDREVALLTRGEFFGELALLKDEPRAATVTAKGNVECITLNRAAFNMLLGPLKEIMQVDWEAREKEMEVTSKGPENWLEDILRSDLELVGMLGRGSFGLVQLMKHKVTKKTYALKQVCKSQVVQLGQQEHVLSEKNVMAQMNHPFIIRLYSTYKDKDYLYFLLEVCLGGELFTLLRAQRLFDEPTARFYAASVVLAFEYMHEKNIVYRDLKPENLLLDTQGYMKIVDFGFAKIVTDRTYTLCGTPDYLAPEVIQGQGHGKGVDWWTLGILIFEMLASYPPFFDEDPMKTYGKIMHGMIEYPRHFSKEAVDLISKLLHLKATKRLGVLKGGATLIKEHPWFAGFDWDALVNRQLVAPFVPDVKNSEDVGNFTELSKGEEEFDFPPYEDDGTGWDKEF